MSDFRLKVLLEVKKHLNFSKASEALFITQPAVSKHIKTLEDELGVQLFERTKQGVKLTLEGEKYSLFAEEILNLYEEGKFVMNQVNNTYEGTLKIGASTTLAQYILPKTLAKFASQHKGIEIILFNNNTEEIENLLIQKKIDVGFIEGVSGKPQLKYAEIGKDELVCTVSTNHPLAEKNSCTIEDILQFPWVFREQGSGSLDILNIYLKQSGVSKKDIHTEAYLGSTESIKSYLKVSDCIGFVSVYSITDEIIAGKLKILDIDNLEMLRSFYSVELHGSLKNIPRLFLNFLNNNIK
ncbi:LysR family transcriptional regulator [Chryseobacterium sp. Ch-15]|uniref:LysR family transcriptional regulator n=1 Tax=Chryseobacterium muglaense TaxID=2893752 RepID=A0A9Q3UR25_9FLAO|nr:MULTISPECIES: LysR family transcriptional regulator [Chryseobacterium]MBD3905285.1 LysR family transcriptional regulator [Chryseobacterium muglaense]MBO6186760.1 LysR family transcriptional regulator [Chryseobacterium sp.]MCC9033958.1 LysR family transcriptional regulator [Chryseobacterium muglaense]MCM2554177.1 LysR family transcriptional regulator [Chryseobacterium muglaense]